MEEPYLNGLDPGEVAALRDLFFRMVDSVPDCGNYEPYVAGGYFQEEENRCYLRELASDDGSAILQAVRGFLPRRRWPRLRQSAKFFLEERLGAAAGYCCDWLRSRNLPASMAATCLPPDASPYVAALVSDYWDDIACCVWVDQNSGYIDRPRD